MTPSSFTAWRERLHLNKAEAAAALGASPNSITSWEKGRTAIPRYIAIACAAIALGIEPLE